MNKYFIQKIKILNVEKEKWFIQKKPLQESNAAPYCKSTPFPNCKSETFFLNAKEKKPSFPTEKAQHIF